MVISPIYSCPEDVLRGVVFPFLTTPDDLVSIAQVSKQWRRLSTKDNKLWDLVAHHFGVDPDMQYPGQWFKARWLEGAILLDVQAVKRKIEQFLSGTDSLLLETRAVLIVRPLFKITHIPFCRLERGVVVRNPWGAQKPLMETARKLNLGNCKMQAPRIQEQRRNSLDTPAEL